MHKYSFFHSFIWFEILVCLIKVSSQLTDLSSSEDGNIFFSSWYIIYIYIFFKFKSTVSHINDKFEIFVFYHGDHLFFLKNLAATWDFIFGSRGKKELRCALRKSGNVILKKQSQCLLLSELSCKIIDSLNLNLIDIFHSEQIKMYQSGTFFP